MAARELSQADRKRVLSGLDKESRRIVAALLESYDGWDAASLTTLRAYALSAVRLARLETSAEPSPALAREVRINLSLLRELNLEPS